MSYLNNGRNWKHFILTSELEGLDGSYHPFGDPEMGTLNIHPQPGNRFIVSTSQGSVSLNPGDQFRLDSDLCLLHIYGPAKQRSPFRAVIATTILSQRNLVFEETPRDIELCYPEIAYSLRTDGPDSFETTHWPDDSVGIDRDIYVLLDGNRHNKVEKIVVRPWANEKAVEWLRKKVTEWDLLCRPSGMFDHYHQISREEKDAEWEKWMDDVLVDMDASEAELKAAAEKDLQDFLGSVKGTAILKVGQQTYIIKGGAVYKNEVRKSRAITPEKLMESGLDTKLKQAAMSAAAS